MFVLCPHCQYLVSVNARTGRPPAVCPKCGQAMDVQAESQAPSEEVAPVEVAPVEVAPIEAAPIEAAPIEAAPVPETTAAPAEREPPAAQLSADAVIAAMAQKSPRKPRAKVPAEAKKPAPAPPVEKPARRKRTASKPAVVASPAPAPVPAKPKREPGPSLGTRIGAWAKSLKPKPKASPEPKKVAPVEPEPQIASVPPIEVATEVPTEVPTEVATLAPTPVETALATELPAIVVEPVRTAPPEPRPTPQPEPLPAVAPPPPKVTPPLARRAAAPSFARTRSGLRAAMPARWTSLAAIGGLVLLLALQLLLAQRDALAADQRWRPTIGALCGMLRCNVPAWREPDAFTMLSRDVRPHPDAAGTLQIDASFRNDARWPQAWPRLVVSLSDIDGRVLGTRAFTSKEYLGDSAGTQPTLAPGQTAAISLAVVEPAPGVVAFSFEFR